MIATREGKKRKLGRRKKTVSVEEKRKRKIKNDHIRSVRAVFRGMGFERLPEVAGQEFDIDGQKGELDDAFLFENILVLIEYTTSNNVSDHIKHKKIIYSNIVSNYQRALGLFMDRWPALKAKVGEPYHIDKYTLRILYCSRYNFDSAVKSIVHEVSYFDYPVLKYFEKLVGVVKMSALSEFFEFLGVSPEEIGRKGVFPGGGASNSYDGSILPESASGFPPGYKVVSFYADAAALLARAYVLRRDGWRGSYQAYQRMLQGPKIEAIRKRIKDKQGVFVNNLIATLPSDIHPEQADGSTIDIAKLTKTEPVRIRLPLRANSIGMIDGQHRLYSYYETKDDDPTIARLRHQQNLLLTGIIHPSGLSATERERFEARLFLSINTNQTNAVSSLRQEIEVLLVPYSTIAIARQVMRLLATSGPLSNHIEQYFFDKGKLKTSSIVSFGLSPLVKLQGTDSLYAIFDNPDKEKLQEAKSEIVLSEYVKFCASQVNMFLSAVKENLSASRWTADRNVSDRLLTVTAINSFLITLRHLIDRERSLNFSELKAALKGISSFDFKAYHSSQYARMAEKICETYFP